MYDQCIKRGAEFFVIVLENSNKPIRMQIQVKWIKPGQGCTKLNMDGAVFGDPRKAGGGGLLRNSEGDWIAGFTRKLGSMYSIMAELWALKEGLSLARQLNLTNLNIEVDTIVLVHLLTNPGTINLMLELLLNDCRNLIKLFPNCSVTHIYREANRCTDKLAKMGATQDTDLLICMNHRLWWMIC